MATERQSPDAYITQSNLDGTISDIQDDPDSPDANWADAINEGANATAHVSFPTPTGNPTTGTGLQEFKVWCRKAASGGGTPTFKISVYENGTLLAVGTATSITNLTGEMVTFTWDASLLNNADGSGVECFCTIKKGGGGGNARSIDVGAVEWNVTYSTGGVTEELAGISNGICSVSGNLKVSKKLTGTSVGVSSVSGVVKVSKKLSGACAGIANVSGAIKISKKLAGTVVGVASVTGTLKRIKGLAGIVSGVASVSGVIKLTKGLAGVSAGITSVSGALKVSRKLAGVVSGICNVSGALKVTRGLSGVVSGIASVVGTLTVSGGAIVKGWFSD